VKPGPRPRQEGGSGRTDVRRCFDRRSHGHAPLIASSSSRCFVVHEGFFATQSSAPTEATRPADLAKDRCGEDSLQPQRDQPRRVLPGPGAARRVTAGVRRVPRRFPSAVVAAGRAGVVDRGPHRLGGVKAQAIAGGRAVSARGGRSRAGASASGGSHSIGRAPSVIRRGRRWRWG